MKKGSREKDVWECYPKGRGTECHRIKRQIVDGSDPLHMKNNRAGSPLYNGLHFNVFSVINDIEFYTAITDIIEYFEYKLSRDLNSANKISKTLDLFDFSIQLIIENILFLIEKIYFGYENVRIDEVVLLYQTFIPELYNYLHSKKFENKMGSLFHPFNIRFIYQKNPDNEFNFGSDELKSKFLARIDGKIHQICINPIVFHIIKQIKHKKNISQEYKKNIYDFFLRRDLGHELAHFVTLNWGRSAKMRIDRELKETVNNYYFYRIQSDNDRIFNVFHNFYNLRVFKEHYRELRELATHYGIKQDFSKEAYLEILNQHYQVLIKRNKFSSISFSGAMLLHAVFLEVPSIGRRFCISPLNRSFNLYEKINLLYESITIQFKNVRLIKVEDLEIYKNKFISSKIIRLIFETFNAISIQREIINIKEIPEQFEKELKFTRYIKPFLITEFLKSINIKYIDKYYLYSLAIINLIVQILISNGASSELYVSHLQSRLQKIYIEDFDYIQ